MFHVANRSSQFLARSCFLSALGWSASGWLPAFAERIAERKERRRHCILLWMTGGPSQTDTFDMKPGHANGGSFHEIQTAAPDCVSASIFPVWHGTANKSPSSAA